LALALTLLAVNIIARNQSEQDSLDWVEVDGVDKRVGAAVEKADAEDDEEAVLVSGELGVDVHKQDVDLPGRPRDDVQ